MGSKRYGLLGKSLVHSFSKDYFAKKFDSLNMDAGYENIELEHIKDFCSLDLNQFDGLNVTIPYKEAIIPYLDEVDEAATSIGAVNTIQIQDGRTKGYNTDAPGFRDSIRPFLKSYHQKALILGTGGASKAIAHVLKTMGLEWRHVSRNPQEGQLGYDELNEHAVRIFPFIINTTPVGTYPNMDERPALPYEAMDEKNFLYDLVYNPSESEFLESRKRARSSNYEWAPYA